MKLGAAIFIALVPIAGHADDRCPAPAAAAENFFKTARNFTVDGTRLDLLTPEFRAVVKAELRCMKKEGVCKLDYDPWSGAQDGDIGKNVSFETEDQDQSLGTAVVAMKATLVLDASHQDPFTTHLVLHRTEAQCWKVNDLITPIGESLLYVLSHHGP